MSYSELKKLKNNIAARAIDAKDEVARLDMPIGLLQMARPLKHGEKRQAFKETQKWMGGQMTIRGICPSDYDMGVLLSCLLIAEQTQPARIKGNTVDGLLLPAPSGDNLAEDKDVVTLCVNYQDICNILVINKNGSSNRAISDSLSNLASIVVDVTSADKKKTALTHLIHSSNGTSTSLQITLSFRLTKALVEGSFASICMKTFRSLPKGAVRILYIWLASWFGGADGARKIGINTLVETVWGEPIKKMTASEVKKRRMTIRNGLMSISAEASRFSVKLVDDDAYIHSTI